MNKIKESSCRPRVSCIYISKPVWETQKEDFGYDILKVTFVIFHTSRYRELISLLLGCKATIVARNGTITSPAYGLSNYPSNQECLYKIRNPGRGPLSLNFNSFEVDKSDYVQVYDGNSTSGLRLHSGNGFSSNSVPKITLTASSGEMLLRFASDALHNNKGWSAYFSAGIYNNEFQ